MADRGLTHLYGYPILRRQDPFKVNLVWGMTHARDPKQMFLKTHEEKNGGTKQAESATGTHTHTHTRAKTITDGHRQTATNKQATDRQPQVDSHRQTATATDRQLQTDSHRQTATDRQPRQTARQTDKQTDKHTDKHTKRQTDRQTIKQTN